MTRTRLLAGILAGSVAVLGIAFMLGRQGTTTGSAAPTETPTADPGYVALDAEIVETTEQGEPLYTLRASRVEQRPASGDITMDRIAMRYVGEPEKEGATQPSPWTLRADHGQMRGGSTLVELRGNVRVAGKPPGSTFDAVIATQQLDFDTRTQDVATTANVQFSWAGQNVHARGFRANLQQEHARLESAVHGRFSQ